MAQVTGEQGKEMEKLRREHVKLEAKLGELERQRWLSASEEAEVKRLKRLKLAKKDRMRALGLSL